MSQQSQNLGGMEWAIETVRLHKLSGTEGLVIMQLGWRDHPSKRTARGIAADLGIHRETVRAAVARLVKAGVLLRGKGGVLVAPSVVELAVSTSDPENGSRDPESGSTRKTGHHRPGKRVKSDPETRSLEKEKKEKGRAPARDGETERRRRSGEVVSIEATHALSPYALTCLREGKSFAVKTTQGVQLVKPGTPDFRGLCQFHGVEGQRKAEGGEA